MGLDIFDGLCIDDVLTTRGRLPTRLGESPRVDGMEAHRTGWNYRAFPRSGKALMRLLLIDQ
jgi:hypothetical protein